MRSLSLQHVCLVHFPMRVASICWSVSSSCLFSPPSCTFSGSFTTCCKKNSLMKTYSDVELSLLYLCFVLFLFRGFSLGDARDVAAEVPALRVVDVDIVVVVLWESGPWPPHAERVSTSIVRSCSAPSRGLAGRTGKTTTSCSWRVPPKAACGLQKKCLWRGLATTGARDAAATAVGATVAAAFAHRSLQRDTRRAWSSARGWGPSRLRLPDSSPCARGRLEPLGLILSAAIALDRAADITNLRGARRKLSRPDLRGRVRPNVVCA